MIWTIRATVLTSDRLQQGAVDNGTTCAIVHSGDIAPVGMRPIVAAARPIGMQ